MSNGTIVLKR